ncbi:DNA-directed RNA polymerase II subunit RPB1-like [Teleopsis dalmanni]|uniref:DNA-directed RNA polymerase II subunit RPB1-like n=1 Tax=Teleopsis dalmanni TaxID=139649 RepID=UPI0018CF0CD3|nr:DNA-directed RNA polymerase II subunit RPB1-like [Teleopsis dalmanni]
MTPQLSTVKCIQFCILSPEETRRMSVTPGGIHRIVAFDNHDPVLNGVCDPRLGAIDRYALCQTCECDLAKCTGHMGHIEFCVPLYHIGFMNKVLNTLRCVCLTCSKLLITYDCPEMQRILRRYRNSPSLRLDAVTRLCVTKKFCSTNIDSKDFTNEPDLGCGAFKPRLMRNGVDIEIVLEKNFDNPTDEPTEILPTHKVLQILKAITDDDCRLMGFSPKHSRPEWMLFQVMPVSSLSVRPAVLVNSVNRAQDDLTFMYLNIVKANNELSAKINCDAAEGVIRDNYLFLQYAVNAIIKNDACGAPTVIHRSGRPLKSYSMRLKGKEGRVRGNLMGKRVDFSARTVITPDPSLNIDQVGVPRSIAATLTFPEVVNDFNIKRLTLLVRRGNHFPGAAYVIRDTGERLNLSTIPDLSSLQLLKGYTVERHMQNDDLVIFNRQPTLHKMSMMGHRCKILPWSTFRLNLSCTSPYNADFDGDEMNLHFPQTQMTRSEVANIHISSRQLITPQSNMPVMGIVQDALIGAYKMTQRNVLIERHEVMNLLMTIPSWRGVLPIPCIVKPVQLWSGKQVFSEVIPEVISMIRTNSIHQEEEDSSIYCWMSNADTKVIIDDGHLVAGTLCKRTLGATYGSLMHITYIELGHKVAADLCFGIQKVANAWLAGNGHSVGIADAIADNATYKLNEEAISNAENEVRNVLFKAMCGKLEPLPGNTIWQTCESKVNHILNDARDKTGMQARNSLKPWNNFKAMVIAGSKGSNINISQVLACVGQQNVEGRRVPFGFYQRTLPHFSKNDYSSQSRGFVANSYLSGLTPSEFFFHAMAGREGLIDTAVKTAEIGYIQRRLIKAMESVMVQYDDTVRTCDHNLLQLLYGEDGLRGEYVEFQSLPTIPLSNRTFENQYKYNTRERLDDYFTREALDEMRNAKNLITTIEEEWAQLRKDREELREVFPTGDAKAVMPINLQRILGKVKTMFHIHNCTKSDLTPIDVVNGVRSLIDKCNVVLGDDRLSLEANYNATLIFRSLIRMELCSKKVIKKHHLTKNAFEMLLGEIHQRFELAKVSAGEMVGALSAQSVGEPATQMTLNTFHFAGVSSKNVTLGVPRLKEIINLSQQPKAPSMTIYLLGPATTDAEKANEIVHQLEVTKMKQIIFSTEIYYDPDITNSVVTDDQDFLDLYTQIPDFEIDKITKWTLRIIFERKAMIDRRITMENLAEKIEKLFGDDLRCLYTDDNADILVMRIYLQDVAKYGLDDNGSVRRKSFSQGANMERDFDQLSFLQNLEQNVLMDITIMGIETVTKVYMHLPTMTNKQRTIIGSDGEYVRVSEWMLETDGTAFLNVIGRPEIDSIRTYTNDIWDNFHVLGVEAVRQVIHRELNSVLTFYGLYVNYRHLALLCDVMTARGHLMSITRHGINRQETGPLMRCSFEETVEVLMDAAAFGECDSLKGVSEKLIVGQIPQIGTGSFSLGCNLELCMKPAKTKAVKKSNRRNMGPFCSVEYFASSPSSELLTPSHTPQTPNFYPFMSLNSISDSPYSPSSDISEISYPSSPNRAFSPSYPMYSPEFELQTGLSPLYNRGYYSSDKSPNKSPSYSPLISTSPFYSALSPLYSPLSPLYSGSNLYNISPIQTPRSSYTHNSPSPINSLFSKFSSSPQSPCSEYSPTSPEFESGDISYSPSSPIMTPNMTKHKYLPDSPIPLYAVTKASTEPKLGTQYSPTSPLTTPLYTSSSDQYSPSSPTSPISPDSPTSEEASISMQPAFIFSPCFSPRKAPASSRYPTYSPSSPTTIDADIEKELKDAHGNIYSSYSPTSPSPDTYSPTSPTSSLYSPTSPITITNSPTLPYSTTYSPTSPRYSNSYSPDERISDKNYPISADNYNAYSPTSPTYSDEYSPESPRYSNSYSPSSPQTIFKYLPKTLQPTKRTPRFSSPYSPSPIRITGASSPMQSYSPTSPELSTPSSLKSSPNLSSYSPTSPQLSSPYTPMSPQLTTQYSPSSPCLSDSSSIISPQQSTPYSPSSPLYLLSNENNLSPSEGTQATLTLPTYTPSSPNFTPNLNEPYSTSPYYTPSTPSTCTDIQIDLNDTDDEDFIVID